MPMIPLWISVGFCVLALAALVMDVPFLALMCIGLGLIFSWPWCPPPSSFGL